jgi:ubiquinone biosynthesis monooxygenase Coq7
MRVNHTGEVCAQGAVSGPGADRAQLAGRPRSNARRRRRIEHLAWTESRIKDLGGRKSLLNPLWYAGSFALGAATVLLAIAGASGFSRKQNARS